MTPSDPTIRAWEAEYPDGKGHAAVLDYEAAHRYSNSNHGSRIHPLVRALTSEDEAALIAWSHQSPRPSAADAFQVGSTALTVAALFERMGV